MSPTTSPTTPLNGIVNLNKPAGLSSRAAVNRVIQASGIRKLKAGHAGTLDPIAEGVLLVCLGKATRLIPYIHDLPKSYVGSFQLGVTSDSDDTESPLQPFAVDIRPTLPELLAVLPEFTGKIKQTPPLYSAVKVDGERAYRLARAGQTADLKPKNVTIHALDVVRYDYPHMVLEVTCGTGTYIRSLGRDIAMRLGSAAVMTALTRSAVGPFELSTSVATSELRRGLHGQIEPMLRGVSQLPQVDFDWREAEEFRHGRPVMRRVGEEIGGGRDLATPNGESEFAVVAPDGELFAVACIRDGQFWPVKVLL